ncbi:MAG: glycerophosphodiester phosphodiesterase [Actinobacteria bacterium]|nr:glycerophosphodiester phosphodiesterase [Actinomycetota bacterium]
MRAADHPYFDLTGPVGLAHRGGALHTPNLQRENTIAAFAEAIRLGFRYLETDVHATKDGQLVAFHDTHLDRVTDGRGAIADVSSADLASVRTAAGDAIPTLVEVLESFPAAHVNIDVKAAGAIAPLIETVRSMDVLDRICVGSFSESRLRAVRKGLGPRLATAAGQAGIVGLRYAPLPLSRLLHSSSPVLQIPRRHVVRGRRIELVTPALVRRVHALGKHLHVWTIDDPREMTELLDLGVDGIVTDDLETLNAVFAARDLRP